MDRQTPRVRWPTLTEPYDQALQQAVAFIREQFEPVGIIAAGSILRGRPDPTSDLDLYVIHLAPWRQRLQRWFNGVPTEMFVNPPQAIREYLAQEWQERRPRTAHMLTTGHLVLACDPVVAALRSEAEASMASPPPAPEDLTMDRYGLALLYEDAVDVAERDPETARMIASRAVEEMIQHCHVRQSLFLPREKDALTALETLDLEAARLARGFYRATSIEEALGLAGALCERVVGARGFFAWDGPRGAVGEGNS